MQAIAVGVWQSADVAQHVCGLEFHHDGSNRVDLFLACLSRLCRFDGVELPPWWPTFLAGCDPLDRSYALQGGPFWQGEAARLAASVPGPRQADVALPDAHWLEFDQDATGIRLAGVFQWLCALDSGDGSAPDPLAWARALSRLPIGQLSAQPGPPDGGLLELVRQHLGWPLWAGIMCGRQEQLKLGFRQDGQLHERLDRFLHSQGQRADGLVAVLADGSGQQDVRLSFDLHLGHQRLQPALALEWYPTSVAAETRHWQLLDHLASRFDLAPELVADVRTKLARLPMGVRPAAGAAQLQSLLPLLEPTAARAAKLSHYKLTLLPEGQARLKSYVSLTWLNADQAES
jgi:hypothetical protein